MHGSDECATPTVARSLRLAGVDGFTDDASSAHCNHLDLPKRCGSDETDPELSRAYPMPELTAAVDRFQLASEPRDGQH